MTSLWIAIGEVEICVLLLILAAAVLALAIRLGARRPAETYFYSGDLTVTGSASPSISLAVDDDYRAVLSRSGLEGMVNADGAVSLAVTVAGTDVTIEERVVAGHMMAPDGIYPDSAIFYLDCLPPNTRVHLRYNSSASSRSASLTFTVKPGFRYSLNLNQ